MIWMTQKKQYIILKFKFMGQELLNLNTKLADAQISFGGQTLSMSKCLTSDFYTQPITTGGTDIPNIYGTPGDRVNTTKAVYQYFYPYVEQWYPSYIWWKEEGKVEKAFRIAQKLMTKRLVKEPKTIKAFIEFVNLLAEEL